VATSFKSGDKFYIGGDKLLPLEKWFAPVSWYEISTDGIFQIPTETETTSRFVRWKTFTSSTGASIDFYDRSSETKTGWRSIEGR
jgi:hypothetical protein